MPKKLSDQKVSDITYLLTQGFSTRHIAEETAVTHSVVSKIAKKKGITLPRGTGGKPSILSTTDKWYAMCGGMPSWTRFLPKLGIPCSSNNTWGLKSKEFQTLW